LGGIALLGAQKRLVGVTMIVASGLFASLLHGASGLEPRAGVEGAMCEVVGGALSWLVVTGVGRRRPGAPGRGATLAIAAAGALASQAAQMLSCPVARTNPHLLLFHFGGVLLAAAFGALNPVVAARTAVL